MVRARPTFIPFPASIFFLAAAAVPAADVAQRLEPGRLRGHVETLASDAFEGRRDGEGARKTREYIARAFEEIGLEPAGEKGGWFGAIPDKDPAKPPLGFNVLGRLAGADPGTKEHIIIGAHHDHLGKGPRGIYHGADDDATGVAVLIEAARAMKAAGARPKRSILFISFDLEEQHLLGSEHFVRHPAVPLADAALYVNLDMLGRDLGDLIPGYLFVVGTESSPALKGLVREAAAGTGLEVGFVGADLMEGIAYSDDGPFRERKVSTLFFSTGAHPDYHRPTDRADRILYGKLENCARIVLETLAAAADLPERPAFSEPKPDIDEARLLAGLVDKILPKAKDLKLGTEELFGIGIIRTTLAGILSRGVMTAEERATLKGVAQQMVGRFQGR